MRLILTCKEVNGDGEAVTLGLCVCTLQMRGDVSDNKS